ncbi:hypothetical protein CSPX01_15042, partial [Colletotrichum filicis]
LLLYPISLSLSLSLSHSLPSHSSHPIPSLARPPLHPVLPLPPTPLCPLPRPPCLSWLSTYMVELHLLPLLGFKQLPDLLDRGTLPGPTSASRLEPWVRSALSIVLTQACLYYPGSLSSRHLHLVLGCRGRARALSPHSSPDCTAKRVHGHIISSSLPIFTHNYQFYRRAPTFI